jgi:hypothetical protein
MLNELYIAIVSLLCIRACMSLQGYILMGGVNSTCTGVKVTLSKCQHGVITGVGMLSYLSVPRYTKLSVCSTICLCDMGLTAYDRALSYDRWLSPTVKWLTPGVR